MRIRTDISVVESPAEESQPHIRLPSLEYQCREQELSHLAVKIRENPSGRVRLRAAVDQGIYLKDLYADSLAPRHLHWALVEGWWLGGAREILEETKLYGFRMRAGGAATSILVLSPPPV